MPVILRILVGLVVFRNPFPLGGDSSWQFIDCDKLSAAWSKKISQALNLCKQRNF